MADRIEVEFGGDSTGAEQAAARTAAVIDQMRQKLQDQNGILGNFAKMWSSAFGVPQRGQDGIRFLDQLGTKSDQTRVKVDGLSKALGQLGAGASVGILAKEVQDMADTWTRSRNLLAAVGVEYGKLNERQAEMANLARETRTSLEPTVALYSRMYRSMVPLGQSEQDVARATEIVNKAFKAGGAAVSEQNAAILQLSQSLGSGVLQGDELRSVRENAPLVAKAIADAYGTNIAGLKKLGEQGKLTSDKVFEAILKGGKSIDEQFARTDATIGDSFNNLRTSLIEYIGNANQATGASKILTGAINFIASNLKTLIDLLIVGASIIGGVFIARAVTPLIASLMALAAQIRVSAVMYQQAQGASIGAAYGMATMTAAAGPLRLALAALGGPIGLLITAAVTIGTMFAAGFGQAGQAVEDFNATLRDSQSNLESVLAYIQDLEDDAKEVPVGTMAGFGQATETAAEKFKRLNEQADILEKKQYDNNILKAQRAIDLASQAVKELQNNWDNFHNKNAANQAIFDEDLRQLTANYYKAYDAKSKLESLGPGQNNSPGDKKAQEAQEAMYEVELFQNRNNKKKQLEIYDQYIETVMRLYGNESKQYQRAVKEKEALEKELSREAIKASKDRDEVHKKEISDWLESNDTKLTDDLENQDKYMKDLEERAAYLAKMEKAYNLDLSKDKDRMEQLKIKAVRRFTDEASALSRVLYERDKDYAQKAAEDANAATLSGIRQRETIVNAGVQRGIVDETRAIQIKGQLRQQELEAEAQLKNKIFELDRQSLQDQLQLEGLKPIEVARINAQLVQLERQHVNEMNAITRSKSEETLKTQEDVANSTAQAWERGLQPVGQALSGLFNDMKAHTNSWENNVTKALRSVWNSFAGLLLKMSEQWIINQIVMTQAQEAGAATRTAVQTTETTTGMALQGTSTLGQIINYAWTAAAGAFSALAGIPYIGPILAVAAAAAALAAVIGFGSNIVSAEGGQGEVPFDGQRTVLHRKEMVLPAKYANPLRDMLSGFGVPASPASVSDTAGENHEAFRQTVTNNKEGDTHLTYAPVTNIRNETLERQLRTQGKQFQRWARNQIRNSR